MQQSYRDLWRLIRLGKPSLPILLLGALLAVAGAMGLLWYPLLTRQLVDTLGEDGSISSLAGVIVAVLVAAAIIGAIGDYLLARVGHEIVAVLRHTLIERVLRLPVSSFDEKETGDRVSRVISDCQTVSDLATTQVANFFSGLLLLVGSVIVLVTLDPMLTFIMVATVLVAFIVVMPISIRMQKVARNIQERTARLSGILTHIFSEIRLVKAFTAEDRERGRSHGLIDNLKKLGFSEAGILVSLQPIMNIAMMASLVIILVYGGGRVAQDELTIGTLTAFILYIFNIVSPLTQLSTFIAELQRAKGASTRIAAILKEDGEADMSGTNSRPTSGGIEFRNVWFSYGGESGWVLKGLDLTFEPGSTTAIAGRSGSGKTTLLSLIERFYSPSKGELLYDGMPIKDIDLTEWRQGIGYVSQNAPIMPGSVRDNITYGLAEEVTDEEVIRAAQEAGASSFIEEMPEGLDTLLIEQGNNLSGGQRQRIAIARMFLRNPDVLILDEATSSLDSETEHRVRESLEKLMQGRTNIIVAHRLSTIIDADQIYYLEDGEVSGVGTHDELVRDHVGYAWLVQKQFRHGGETDAVVGADRDEALVDG